VDLPTGLLVMPQVDLSLPDIITTQLIRTYRNDDTRIRPFGLGTTHNFEMFLVGSTAPWTYQELILPDGGRIHYDRQCPNADGSPCCPEVGGPTNGNCQWFNASFRHAGTPGEFYNSSITFNSNADQWELKLQDGMTYVFPDAENLPLASQGALVAMRD